MCLRCTSLLMEQRPYDKTRKFHGFKRVIIMHISRLLTKCQRDSKYYGINTTVICVGLDVIVHKFNADWTLWGNEAYYTHSSLFWRKLPKLGHHHTNWQPQKQSSNMWRQWPNVNLHPFGCSPSVAGNWMCNKLWTQPNTLSSSKPLSISPLILPIASPNKFYHFVLYYVLFFF